jgi:hypothetical protein
MLLTTCGQYNFSMLVGVPKHRAENISFALAVVLTPPVCPTGKTLSRF